MSAGLVVRAKAIVKDALRYQPRAETEQPRDLIASCYSRDAPWSCPPDEGDLLHALIVRHGIRTMLEVGFSTGSTSIYMLHASTPQQGRVTSVDYPEGRFNQLGLANVAKSGLGDRHELILENSNIALPRLFASGAEFGLILLDGWKTFDHLALEVYFAARMLSPQGFLFFDDSKMPSVDRVIRMLRTHYLFQEIDYDRYGERWQTRLYQVLTQRTMRRTYSVLQKSVESSSWPTQLDWAFYADF